MDSARIASRLEPYAPELSPAQLAQVSVYLGLLLRWNARINLTAVRDAENIVTRHFGESFFAARHLSGARSAIDLGAGAGFPGLPIKIYAPALSLTLIESRHKKAAFLQEVVRALDLRATHVFCGRAQDFPHAAELVTLRAVERFQTILPTAARLVAPAGRLALLIGASQLPAAHRLLPAFSWSEPVIIPGSSRRVLLVGCNQDKY